MEFLYFPGCYLCYDPRLKKVARATATILNSAGVEFGILGEKENCCGTPMLAAGKWDLFVETMRLNIQAVKEAGADTVITSCPACDMMWRQVYPEWAKKLGIEYGIEAKHYSEVIAENIQAGEFTFLIRKHKQLN